MAAPSGSSPPLDQAALALGRTVASAQVQAPPVGSEVEDLPEVTWEETQAPTIVPPAYEGATQRSASLWRELTGDAPTPHLEEIIGAGGMGEVWLSSQPVLGRKVAVKTLRASPNDAIDQAAALELLREARITGALEHPNVVPVYDVQVDEHGAPRVILKRIQGEEWLSLIDDEERVRERFGEALLPWNLKVLLQVCNAVSFAHSRGILHRDLKPANVMIGEFGQVYLLDWGIAVGLHEDVDPAIPRVSEVRHTAGTPSYMAPEMVAGSEQPLSVRTDVFLLGSILFQIVTGRAPHHATTLKDTLANVREPVAIPEDAPAELRDVLARALAFDPADRYPTVEAFRRDVDAAVSHGDASRLAAEAERQLDELRARIERGATSGEVRKLFSACRFTFRASLMAWPDNPVAKRGFFECVELMIDLELAEGQTDAAAALASEIDDLPMAVRDRVAAALEHAASAQSEAARLAQLGRSQDKRTGQGARMVIATFLGSMWTIAPLTQVLLDAEEDTYLLIIGRSSAFVLVLAAMAYWARAKMLETAINRHLLAGMAFALVSQIFLTLGGVFLGLRPDQVATLGIFVWFAFTTMFAVTTEPRLWPTAVAHLIAFLVASLVHEALLYASSAAKFVLTINALVVWRPDPQGPERRSVSGGE